MECFVHAMLQFKDVRVVVVTTSYGGACGIPKANNVRINKTKTMSGITIGSYSTT